MNVFEARKLAKKLRWIGMAGTLLSIALLILTATLTLYIYADSLKYTAMSGLGYAIQRPILALAAIIPTWCWTLVPAINIRAIALSDFGNIISFFDSLKATGIIALVITSQLSIKQAGELHSNASQAFREAQHEAWKNQAAGSPPPSQTVINQYVVHVQLQEADSFWKNPFGVVLLGLIVTYIGAVLTRMSGLT